jgi:uncharacterized membrane protein YraQ (UPF0718 family)
MKFSIGAFIGFLIGWNTVEIIKLVLTLTGHFDYTVLNYLWFGIGLGTIGAIIMGFITGYFNDGRSNRRFKKRKKD